MENDKVFAAYALTLIAATASVLTATIVSGIAVVPSVATFLEHLVLAFGFRAAYKSFGGVELPAWLAAARETVTQATGAHADAMN